MAAPNPDGWEIGGVPASDARWWRERRSFEETRSIMPPPPCHGGIFSGKSRPPIEEADPGGPVHLVRRGGVEVARQLPHIYRQMGYGLGSVHDYDSAPGMGQVGNLPNGIDRSEDVGDVGQCNDAGPWTDQSSEALSLQLALVVHGQGPDHRSCLLGQRLPRHQVQ